MPQFTPSNPRRLAPRVGVVLLVAALTVGATAAARAQDGAPPANESRLASDEAFLEAVLSDPSANFALRHSAAERLVRAGTPEARRAIDKALRAGGVGRRAAIDALDRGTAVSAELTDALIESAISFWIDGAHEAHASATRALGLSNARAADLVGALALSTTTPTARRFGAIGTLGELMTRAAATQLIGLLAEGRNESAEVVAAAGAALDRCVGRTIGNDPAAWRAWWSGSADAASVDDEQVRAMAGRVAEAERALADEQRRAERLESRVVDAYEQLFLRLTQSERLDRSSDLLDDELAAVRTFGVAQLERMLRNGERADDSTRRQALVLLDDPLPALRMRGARLLDDLGVADLPTRLAERLPKEKDVVVAATYLAVLANRPQAETFPTLIPLVKEPALSEAACRAIATLVDARRLPREWEALVLPTLREVVAARPNAAAVQLLAMAGEEADIQKVTTLLDAPDAGVRRGAAEGLRRRGVRRPLIERSNDPAIYAPLVAALADEPKALDTVRVLVGVPPPPDMAPDWNASVARLLRELPTTDLIAADRLLADVPACERRTRIDGLGRLASGARTGLAKADIEEGLRRFVDLLVAEGRGEDAVAMFEESAPKPDDPNFDALFRAQALTGNFREAARLVPDPKRWIELLASISKDPSAARPLADEIALRYGDVLSAEERATFEKLRRDLPAPHAATTALTPSGDSVR